MLLSYIPTPEFWIAISAAGAFISKIVVDELRYRKERQAKLDEQKAEKDKREQDRLDLAAVAALTAKQLETFKNEITNFVDEKGKDRLKVLLGSAATTRGLVKDMTKKAELAVETSNGIKTSLIENGVKLIETKEQI
jgi:hypothetical protein